MITLRCVEESPTGGLEVGKIYLAREKYKWQGKKYFKVIIGDKIFLYGLSRFEVVEED
tara:strand:+ start:20691 stop:20864 length:174 start_codon:yes stop_codon:yes gene_type:complete